MKPRSPGTRTAQKNLLKGPVAVSQPEARCVRTLLARYAEARIALAEKPDPARRRRLADVVRDLCEATGARTATEAIAAADDMLAAARRPTPRPSRTPSRTEDGLVAA
ncbi:DUF5133 domain-containing protein [Streptomyces alfalfae]|uniref:DUF5133 domain-containing protein n=1 Tax=Streptomyces alfalfae TaxID=1642299 RepID=A0A7T4U0J3_9ACTN|nr:DUF5133 domain-containing protein [Streptomyces alfalfae]QUI34378.1 DUF5133 domain-containing protein [Streptomyces alfalfae]